MPPNSIGPFIFYSWNNGRRNHQLNILWKVRLKTNIFFCGKTKNKYIESKHVNVTRKKIQGTTRSKSQVWTHFTKVIDIEDSGIVKAKCRYCDQIFKADSKINDTSRLRRHITNVHKIKLTGPLKIRKKAIKEEISPG
jgi:hypothetical protein